MSRTYKTRPVWVNVANGYLATEAVHRHDNSPCNLPDRRETHSWWVAGDDCFWTWVYDGRNLCGCNLCTGYVYRRAERRQSRRKAKTDSLRWRGEFNASGDIEEW